MSRVPGTFKERPPELHRDLSSAGVTAENWLRDIGAIHAERHVLGDCTVMLAREPMGGEFRWHLSISHPSRYPTWDEIKTAVYSLPALGDAVMAQVLGPVGAGEWVNVAENCFHLYEIHDPAWFTSATDDRAPAVISEKETP